ncbi:MAG: hypothetical protein IJY82_00210 [Oscillospiraceae bacterium]|nr:hypothetical protein [Oscillospiraceae bacterium]MBQ8731236.1 hypothetical protein [Oscillospiraceae bacterium]
MTHSGIPIPKLRGELTPVYRPSGDLYRGEETEKLQPRKYYPHWGVGGFSAARFEDGFVLFGMTQPITAEDGEDFYWQLFRAESPADSLKKLIQGGVFLDREKLLYPIARPDEPSEIHHPFCGTFRGKWHLLYGPRVLREVSAGQPQFPYGGVPLFSSQAPVDYPFLFPMTEDRMLLIFCEGNAIKYRITEDMRQFSPVYTLQTSPFRNTTCAYPALIRRNGIFYLFWNIAEDGIPDDRALVFAAEELNAFEGAPPLTVLSAKCPRPMVDETGEYLLATLPGGTGVGMAQIEWR